MKLSQKGISKELIEQALEEEYEAQELEHGLLYVNGEAVAEG